MVRHHWVQPCLGEAEEIAVPNVSLELYPGPEVIELVFQRLDAGEQDARQRCSVCTGSQPVPDVLDVPLFSIRISLGQLGSGVKNIRLVQYDVGPPFAAITASTLLGRLSTRFRSVFMGIFDHSSRSAFVRSHTDVGREGLALSLRSNSSQRCSIGLRSGLCAGQSSSSTPDSVIHVFMDLALCTGAQSCWKRKGPAPNCSHKVGSMELSKMSWYAEAFRVPFTGTKGPSPAPEKQPHTIIPPPPKLYNYEHEK
ncbi:uncharacterized protein LOC131361290 isoform X2 [Hemibagrus wyckioides]|uniref:uncharacterized protein LOC131361290 isoform X2 n=1 Tax=Hemibagrus wyckioides TaxID=337641 RepID=UPI00266CD7B0|nr:uncharacterized protein LOC131361290 isoform X2 [Hemibagrus wyckioides]